MTIPFSRPDISQIEIDAVVEVMKSGWLTIGPKVKEFEDAIKNYTEAKHVVTFDSCTSALTIGAEAIKFKEYPRALVPALTFVATANAMHRAGYKVSFQDVAMDGNMDAECIDGVYDLIVPVHFAGQVCDLKKISEHTDHILEDAAHAIGAKYYGKHVGLSEYSDGACFSFYPTKNMTTIEGGALVTNHESIAKYSKECSLHGLSADHIYRYERSSTSRPTVKFCGLKANMTDVEAAVGIVQLRFLNYFTTLRKSMANTYIEELSGKIEFLNLNGRDHVYHMFVVLVENRDEFIRKMAERDIKCGVHYSPIIPAHPFYADKVGYREGMFPVAEYISNHCVSLPLYNGMSEGALEKVIDSVKEIL